MVRSEEDPGAGDLESLVARGLQILDEEGSDALEQFCAAHPAHREEVLRRCRVIAGVGLAGGASRELPTAIGPYQILEVLGEGGMGTVYQAERREPVRQLVAIKVIKLGMDSRDVLARFELERRALAAMNHRCIARILDAGETERGQPYFVMEAVEGQPLTDYCDKRRLSLPERIALFQQVCAGVQHAHQKGIIHRDLKPGNILVVREGDEALPKILDFGLAKATNRELLTKTIYTERAQLLGTPEYMAPEQAAGDGETIDTRADVYSLGVILYELLSGELPFRSEVLRRAGWAEIQRQLLEDEPAKPSSRITTVGDRSTGYADRRRTTLHALAKELRGDLDWIVLKAMAKEPERRYGSASELAMDLRRHQQHEPVLAGPPSASYRLRKLLRRYRVQAAAAAVVFVSLLVAGAVVSVLYVEAKAARAEAVANLHDAERVADFLEDLFRSADPDQSLGQDVPVRVVLEQGQATVRAELRDQPRIQMRMLTRLGRVYAALGEFERARSLLRDAATCSVAEPGTESDLVVRTRLADVEGELGELAVAARSLRELWELAAARFGPGHELSIDAALGLARVLHGSREDAEAERIVRDVMAALRAEPATSEPGLDDDRMRLIARTSNELGAMLFDTGRHEEAAAAFEESVAILRRLHPAGHSNLWRCMGNLANCARAAGDLPKAERLARNALDEMVQIFTADHVRVAFARRRLAQILRLRGQGAEAMRELELALAVQQKALPDDHPDIGWTLNDIASTLLERGDAEQALPHLRRAVQIAEARFVEHHPHVGTTRTNLADCLARLGTLAEADSLITQVLAHSPATTPEGRRTRASRLWILALVRGLQGRHEDGVRSCDEALGLLEPLAGVDQLRGACHARIAWLQNERGRAAEAKEHAEKALAHFGPSPGDDMEAAIASYQLCWAEFSLGRHADAEIHATHAIEALARIVPAGNRWTAFAHSMRGAAREQLGRPMAEVVADQEQALALRRRLMRPGDYWLAESVVVLGMAYTKVERLDEAKTLLEEALAMSRDRSGRFAAVRNAALTSLAALHRQRGEENEAASYEREIRK